MNFSKKTFWILLFFTFQPAQAFISCGAKKRQHTPEIVTHGTTGIKDVYANALFDSGLTYVETGNYKLAKDYFYRADRAYPESPIILDALATSLARTNFPDMAAENYQHVLELDSNFIQTYINYGNLLNTRHEYGNASKILLAGIAKEHNPNKFQKRLLYINLAVSCANLGQKQVALKVLAKAKQDLLPGDLYEKITSVENEIKKMN